MKGILFKPDMIQAILDGRKTQTRRIQKNPEQWMIQSDINDKSSTPQIENENGEWIDVINFARYKQDEIIYVKETWCYHTWIEGGDGCPSGEMSDCFYRLNDSHPLGEEGKWKSPMFMPEWASRIKLQITDIRVQRIQDISFEDIQKEGVREITKGVNLIDEWIFLWDSINKEPYSWKDNPWVFAYTFKVVK